MRVAERDAIWTRDGEPIEDLPDPLGAGSGADRKHWPEPPKRRRRWPLVLYSVSALLVITLIWLVITAPLSRALEPLG